MISRDKLRDKIARMVSATAIYLREDVKEALVKAYDKEGSPVAKSVFKSIIDNVKVAEDEKRPLCQDTGTLVFYVKAGESFHLLGELASIIKEATIEATLFTPLRPNAVDVITGKNSGDNTGERIPWIEWEIVPTVTKQR